MPINPNSREAYEAIKGTLSARQRLIFEYLVTFGPLSIKGIAVGLGIPDNEVSPRIGELKAIWPPVILCMGTTKNPGNNRTADLWAVNMIKWIDASERQEIVVKQEQQTLFPKDHLRTNYHEL